MNETLKVDAGEGYYYYTIPNGTVCLIEDLGDNMYNYHQNNVISLYADTEDKLVEWLELYTK